MSKARFNMRTAGGTKRWLSGYAQARSTTESQVVTELLVALREGRLKVEPPPPKDEQLRLRLPEELDGWLAEHANEIGTKKAKVVSNLLEALREGRVEVESSMAPNPFPADSE